MALVDKNVRLVCISKLKINIVMNLTNNKTPMNWEQAKKEMKNGQWVRHTFFMKEECITEQGGMILFEDGYLCTYDQFVKYRFRNFRSIDAWSNSGWQVVPQPNNLIKCKHCGIWTTQPENECFAANNCNRK